MTTRIYIVGDMNSSNLYNNKKLKEYARRLRKQATRAEAKLWNEVLRGRQMQGYTFLRQRPILFFIADFMCKKLRLMDKHMNGRNSVNRISKDKANSKSWDLPY